MTNYEDFCKKCIQGKIGFKPDFYIIEKNIRIIQIFLKKILTSQL